LVPRLEDIREQRADLMFYCSRSYDEWATMVPWQRDDYIRRYVKRAKEQKKQMEDAQHAQEHKMRSR
jgi:hypothetical protein